MADRHDVYPSILAGWAIAAAACTALPYLRAWPWLMGFGDMGPLFAAILIGSVVSVAVTMLARRLAGADMPSGNLYAVMDRRSAALLGLLQWGIPVGLIFSLQIVLESGAWITVLPNIVLWLLGGLAFGLLMRFLATRKRAG